MKLRKAVHINRQVRQEAEDPQTTGKGTVGGGGGAGGRHPPGEGCVQKERQQRRSEATTTAEVGQEAPDTH